MSFILETLLQQPESKTLEFKRDLSSPKPLLKTLVAFANTAGGRLVIGVTDDYQLIGVDDPLTEEERLCNLIADAISPRLVPNVEMVTVEGKTLLVVEVYLSNSRPHWLKAKGPELGVYVRLGSTNRQADRELIAELPRSIDGVAFDEMPMQEAQVEQRLELRLESRLESLLAQYLGHKTVSGELHKQIKRLLELQLIEMTVPDKPNSRLQKYWLTENGQYLINSLLNGN